MKFWQGGNLSEFDELHAEDFVDHCPAGRAGDREGFKRGIADLYRAFPDFKAVIDDLLVDPEPGKVCLRWHATGTHQADFMGFAPSGETLHFQGIEIIHIASMRVVARWGEWDGLALLEQLGAEWKPKTP